MNRAERTRTSGFSLRLEQGQGRLVLTERRLSEVLAVECLQLGLRHVPARLDMSDGVERFRHAYTRLDALTVSIEDQDLALLMRRRTASSPLQELDLRLADGDLVLAGEVFEGVPFVCRARVEPASLGGERALLLSVYELRLYGPCRASGPEVATLLLQAADLGDVLAGPTCAVFDPVDLLCAEIFAELGWKLPDRNGLRLTEARVDAGRLRIVAARTEASRGGLRPVAAPEGPAGPMRYRRFLADYEAKTLYAAIEADVAAGRIERAAAAYERQLELHPDHPFLVSRLLQLWLARSETRVEADALARSHLERYPDDFDALVALGVVQHAQGNPLAAAEHYRRVAHLAERQGDPIEAAQAWCGVARAVATREPALAIEALERALVLRRRLPGALRALADLYERAGNLVGAVQARERLLTTEGRGPERLRLLLELGRLALERTGDLEAAVGWFERVIDEAPDDIEGWLGLSASQERCGRLLPAVRALDRAATLLQQRGDLRRAARVLVRLGDLWRELPEGGASTAALRYRQALLLEPAHPAALLGLAETAAAEGDPRRARAHLEELIRLGDTTPGGERVEPAARIEAHLRLGRLYAEAMAEPQAAIGHYQKALAGTPEQAEEALSALEALFTTLGRYDDLARILALAAERTTDPASRGARLARLAAVLRDATGDLKRAAQLMREAVGLAPQRPDYLRSLVELQRRRGAFTEAAAALAELAAVVEEPRELAAVYAERAELLRHKLNRSDEAGESWSLALGCDPVCVPALEGLADIYREQERSAELAGLLARHAGLESDPAAATALYLELGRLNRSVLNRPEHARDAYEKALARSPRDPEALRGLADILFDLGRAGPAWDLYGRLHEAYESDGYDEPAAPFLLRLAQVCEQLHRGPEALGYLERARDFEPERLEIYEAAQDVLLREGDVEGIIRFFTTGLGRARRSATRSFLSRRAGRLAWRELRRPAEAAPLLDEALQHDGHDADLVHLRLEVATALADWSRVAELLKGRLERAPAGERPPLLTRLAELAFGALGRPDEGLQLAAAALAEDAEFTPAVALLAERAFSAGDWSAAAEAYARLWTLSGANVRPEDRLRLAIARMYSGRPSEALPILLALRSERVALPDLIPTLAEACLQAGDADALADVLDARLVSFGDGGGREGFLRRAAELFERSSGPTDGRALEAWRRVLDLHPGDAEAEAAVHRLAPAPSVPPVPASPTPDPEPAAEPADTEPPRPAPGFSPSPYRTTGPDTASGSDADQVAENRRRGVVERARSIEAAAQAARDPQEAATQWLALGDLYRDELHDPDAAEIAFAEAMEFAPPGSVVWTAAEEALEELAGARSDWPTLLDLYAVRLTHGIGDRTELLLMKASAHRLAGDSAAAVETVRAALPDERAVEQLVALLEAHGDVESAAAALTMGLETLPGDEAARRRWRAADLLAGSRPREACDHYALAAEVLRSRELADAWVTCARAAGEPLLLATALASRADLHAAEGPDAMRRSRLLHEAAGLVADAGGPLERARHLAESAVAAWPENVEALERLAALLEAIGDADGLADCLAKQIAAAVAGPWRGQLGVRLARVHGELRRDRDAAFAVATAAAEDLAGRPELEALAPWLASPAAPAEKAAAIADEPIPPAGTPREGAVDPARRHERALTDPQATLGERTSAWRTLVEVRTRIPDLQRLLGLLETRLLAADNPTELATLHALAGELWRGRLGHPERAREALLRALAIDADCPRAHLGLGILEMDRGALDAALEHLFRALVNRAPPGAGLLAEEELAAFHRMRRALTQQGHGAELTTRALALLAENPTSRPALDVVDGASSQQREWATLLGHYERALAASDDGRRNARLWRRTAELHQAMGQTEAALSALGEALRLVPEDAHTRVAALRLAHRLGPDERFVAHGEALLALPAAQWVTATETDPAWLRSPEALGEALKAARGPR
jgi:tetratricopeptide (TPR) repeat protein